MSCSQNVVHMIKNSDKLEKILKIFLSLTDIFKKKQKKECVLGLMQMCDMLYETTLQSTYSLYVSSQSHKAHSLLLWNKLTLAAHF